ncbi:G-type lectin S-receptor-like serine/threonine-protein kinase At1g61500 [Rosa chinensis]|uniref:G-type lectin S-receptor-like serine/threonine-protein kinase At1g61500 n=1 Tax=Rosa chinensis TaxID=74649 RepID=UPI001AD931A2|nr:G-type lectin S-receptor-like serine/threonine-protein kinase At1g61500 [Rosa chinensis]
MFFFLFIFLFSLLPSHYYCAEVDQITLLQPLAQGQILVSPGHIFELGFFSPNNSAKKYVGIWHKDISQRKVVWVANREKPLAVADTSASLTVTSNGNLKLVDGKQKSIWSTNIASLVSSSNTSSVAAVLLDNGNFVVNDHLGAELWKSFDYPGDTVLPNMVLRDSKSGKGHYLSSWKAENDPSPGKFLLGLAPQTPSQGTVDFSYSLYDKPVSYIYISPEGTVRLRFSKNDGKWHDYWQTPKNPCDIYGACGPFGVCKASASPICKCLKGFVPKSSAEWSKGNWTRGCMRQTKLFCERQTNKSVSSRGKKVDDDGFWKMVLKIPDFHEFITALNAEETSNDCKLRCLNNCSCLAYAFVNNIGCLVWSKDLIDIQQFSASVGVDLYIRLARSELGEGKPIKLIGSLTAIVFVSILAAIVFGFYRRRANQKRQTQNFESTGMIKSSRDGLREYIGKHDPLELQIYDFDSILIATNNFSVANKLGQGGFGPVYKGMLQDGKEVAVKRLSSSSGQGIEEFKNEMLLIYNLQHKNLVRIMGCCVKEDEKLLIYEFMPNKSLDTFLFDTRKRAVLDWVTRFNIIHGVARGLLYLHHDSYVKVIHRDMKVSNILLDEKMNPKISDFGLARIVEGTQNLENTQKVVGTRGYMSPEYAMGGMFSEKSDVYSFGVLVLEIISSKKNTSFCLYDQQLGFLAYAWNLWNEGRGLELVDEILGDSYSSSEVLKCVHIGLLCVQDNAVDRPTMADIALMLNSEKDGPHPKLPLFTIQISAFHHQPHSENTNSSKKEASITMIEGR